MVTNETKFTWKKRPDMLALLELVFEETKSLARQMTPEPPMMEQKWAAAYSFVELWNLTNTETKLTDSFHRSAFCQIDLRFQMQRPYKESKDSERRRAYRAQVKESRKTASTSYREATILGFKLHAPNKEAWTVNELAEYLNDKKRRNEAALQSRGIREKIDEHHDRAARKALKFDETTKTIRCALGAVDAVLTALRQRFNQDTEVVLTVV